MKPDSREFACKEKQKKIAANKGSSLSYGPLWNIGFPKHRNRKKHRIEVA